MRLPVTEIEKTSSAAAPTRSLAISRTWSDPASVAAGVPEKVRVVASKCSHVGSAAPSARRAEYESTSFLSTSVKVLAGAARLKALPACAL